MSIRWKALTEGVAYYLDSNGVLYLNSMYRELITSSYAIAGRDTIDNEVMLWQPTQKKKTEHGPFATV